jgi:hypothetical protein
MNEFMKFNYGLILLVLLIFGLMGCVSKKRFKKTIFELDSAKSALAGEKNENYIITINLLNIKAAFLEHIRNDSILANKAADLNYLNNGLVSFPNPPPQPSSHYLFNNKKFQACKIYKDIDTKIFNALQKAGYGNKLNYFLFDDGFAIATDLEEINNDGTSKVENSRWLNSKMNEKESDFSIKDYLKSLFLAQPGYYRSFVFIVSPSINNFSPDSYKKELYSKYLSQGSINLPRNISANTVPENTKVIVLLYLFKKNENSNEADLLVDGVDALQHLTKAFIIQNFSNVN